MAHPTGIVEDGVGWLLPPACREEVLGDLYEQYVNVAQHAVKLQRRKAPVEMFVVDRADNVPTENQDHHEYHPPMSANPEEAVAGTFGVVVRLQTSLEENFTEWSEQQEWAGGQSCFGLRQVDRMELRLEQTAWNLWRAMDPPPGIASDFIVLVSDF